MCFINNQKGRKVFSLAAFSFKNKIAGYNLTLGILRRLAGTLETRFLPLLGT